MAPEKGAGTRPRTIDAALGWAQAVLGEAGTESPRLAADIIMAHILGWERARLLAHNQDDVTPDAWQKFRKLVRRHAAGEPLQYLTGVREFYGRTFRVTPSVLIPRPETEILVEKAVDLGRRVRGIPHFADVGTGSGCIAVSLARELPEARGYATDFSLQALEVAHANAVALEVAGRVGFVCCDLLDGFPAHPCFDFVVSNPPYVSGPEMDKLPAGILGYEPRMALYGGESGLDAYRRLIPQAAQRLTVGGWLLLEVGAGQAGPVSALIIAEGLTLVEVVEDLQKISRCVVAQRCRIG